MDEPMVVIVEGVDGSGKTTLCRRIQHQAFGVSDPGLARGSWKIVPVGPPEVQEGFMARYVHQASLVLKDGLHVIYDRFHYGDHAYGTEFRGGTNDLLPHEWEALEELLLTMGAVVILCEPPFGWVKDRLQERRDDPSSRSAHPEFEASTERSERVYHLFDEAYNMSQLPRMKYDPTDEYAFEVVRMFLHGRGFRVRGIDY